MKIKEQQPMEVKEEKELALNVTLNEDNTKSEKS